MSEKVEKAIDISKYKLGQVIKDLKCPRCKSKGGMRLMGLYHRETNSHELECSCFYTQRVYPKNVEFTYEEPKEPKRKKGDNN
jgi:Zn ribbon nucleic-acid-binding protein